MQLVNYKNIAESQGNLSLFYATSGAGKTSTILQTCEDPLVYLTAEGRKIKTTIAAINRPELRMKVGVYEGFEDLIDTCMDTRKFDGAKTIFLDSLTHLMLVHLSLEILQENFSAKSEKEKEEIFKALTQQVKMSQEAYGALSGQMNRLMRALQKLTMSGYDVICTARQTERPKWNRSLSAAPALMGQEFSKSMDGFFDFIGYCQPVDINPDDKPLPANATTAETWKRYAPYVSFNASDDYLAKWTGLIPPKGIIRRKLHVKNLLNEANGIFTHSTVNSTLQSQPAKEEASNE